MTVTPMLGGQLLTINIYSNRNDSDMLIDLNSQRFHILFVIAIHSICELRQELGWLAQTGRRTPREGDCYQSRLPYEAAPPCLARAAAPRVSGLFIFYIVK